MFVSKYVFWSRSRSQPSFFGWSRILDFLPGAGVEIKIIWSQSRGKMAWLRNTANQAAAATRQVKKANWFPPAGLGIRIHFLHIRTRPSVSMRIRIQLLSK